MKKNKKKKSDRFKSIHRADREIELENEIGWKSKVKIFKNKKKYNRKRYLLEDFSPCT